MKYAFIKAHSSAYSVSRLCQVLEVSTSGYYDWRDRPESNHVKENRRLLTKISLFHKVSREIYGSPRIYRDLLDAGEAVSIYASGDYQKTDKIEQSVMQHEP